MSEAIRSVDELEQEPINNVTKVGEFDWEDMNRREVLNVVTMLEEAKDTYTKYDMDVPYTLRKKYRAGSLRLNDFH